MKSVLVHEIGGPDSLTLADVPIPTPGGTDVLVKVAVTGVNFIDVYFRTGQYKAPLPAVIGSEAAGVVHAVGAEVRDFAPGDRVAYAMVRGSYAEYARVPATQLLRLPDGVPLDVAAAVLLQGLTAHYLTRSVYALKAGDTCLVHAAAGGTGLLLVQMARQRGARVFGTTSTPAKADIVRTAGADDVFVHGEHDFAAEARRLTDGRGVDVVYDGVGKATFDRSLDSLRVRGMMVLFGASSGAVPAFEPAMLNAKGSLFLTRPGLAHYIATREELVWRAGELFALVESGALAVRIDRTFALAQAADAHRALESRATVGKLLLTV
jgi:NADPH2:quinone reductase